MAAFQTASMQENPFKTIAVMDEKPKDKPKKKSTSVRVIESRAEKSVITPENADRVAETTKTDYEKKPMPVQNIDLSKLRIGSKVLHDKYGEGTIKGFKPGKVLIAFDVKITSFRPSYIVKPKVVDFSTFFKKVLPQTKSEK